MYPLWCSTHSLVETKQLASFSLHHCHRSSMASLNLSSLQSFSFHRVHFSFSQNTPTLSFNCQPKPATNARPISLKPYVLEKPRMRVVVLAVKSLEETEAVTVSPENDGPAGELPSGAGVYAVYDKVGEVQFIGLSRNIAASVSSHWKSVPELCGSVKVSFYFFSGFWIVKCVRKREFEKKLSIGYSYD